MAMDSRSKRRNAFDVAKEMAPKPQINVQELLKRRDKAKADLDMWRSLLETAYSYALPNYNPFVNMGMAGAITPGTTLNADIYDLTLPIAHNKLVNKMLVGMIPQGQQWIKFTPGDIFGAEDSEEYRDALVETQRITDAFFNILDRSNFYLSVSESVNDCVISTGVLAINEGDRKKPLRFEAVPASHVMFESNAVGGICAVFRDWYDIRVDYINVLWSQARLPSNKKMSDTVTLYECAYIDYQADPREMYKYVVMTDQKEILFEQADASWPWVIYRMKKLPGETRGRGPSLDAYPTAATINEAIGDELISAAYVANPMYMVASTGQINQKTFTAKPGAFIPVSMVMGQWPIQSFPGGGNIQFSQLIINDFRQQINELLYTAPLGPISAPDKTATEQQLRFMENLESFSAMVPRLQTEFFDPTITRCMYIINKVAPETFGNISPEIREKMISVDGEILNLKYETPLMTARGEVKKEALLRWFQTVASMIGPEAAAAALNPVKMVQSVGQYTGAPMNLIKNERELNAELEKAAAIANQQMEEGMIPGETQQA